MDADAGLRGSYWLETAPPGTLARRPPPISPSTSP